MLGYRGTSVFAEFLLKLSTSDPRDMFRLSKIRAAAIESATEIVVLDGEEYKFGWTMLSPVDFNVKISDKFEEKILLVVSDRRFAALWGYFYSSGRCRLPRLCISSYVTWRLVHAITYLPEVQSYDYSLDKVKMFTRVPLGDIVGIQKGTKSTAYPLNYELTPSRRLHTFDP